MSAAFPLPLRVEFIDGDAWQLVEPFAYESQQFGIVNVPAGTITDFASIPKIFHNLLSPTGGIGKAAVIHDRVYTTGERTRAEADAILNEAMAAESHEQGMARRKAITQGSGFIPDAGIGAFKRWLIYSHVRMWGWAAWNKHRKEESLLKA